ncbi:MAG: iron ABC transporter permease [Desulfobulbaceae bacterium]
MAAGKRKGRFDAWVVCAWAASLITLCPVVVLLLSWQEPATEIWRHMAENLLGDLVRNTFLLVAGVVGVTAILGTSLAWLTSACVFPGRRFFSWALLLPMAVPTYVLAFVFLGIFDFAGPVQGLLHEHFGPSARFPEVRNAGGMILVMSLSLYPYVYLLARGAFLGHAGRLIEAAQSLGSSRKRAFYQVVLPMARPWIAGGLFLVMMETLADFGAVSIFNFDTFTTVIYKAWFGFFSIEAAAQLSSILVVLVLAVLTCEQYFRGGRRYAGSARTAHKPARVVLAGSQAWLAFLYSLAVFLASFGIPFLQLLIWAWKSKSGVLGNFSGYVFNSLLLAAMAAAFVCLIALLLAVSHRRHPKGIIPVVVRIATLGYALPGTVLAVALVILINRADASFAALAGWVTGADVAMILQGGLLTMLLAYAARFMAVGFNPVQSALQQVTTSMDEAARSLGVRGMQAVSRIHVPLIRQGILTAAILVFVDVMKEMPITLMTRPFGWDTLAVKIFELTSEGEWQAAALPAALLITAGVVPVALLVRRMEKT